MCMVKAYDVPADRLIARLADILKQDQNIVPPPWARFVKTGSHAMRLPYDRDWWYVRCASLLRKIYIHGPIGLSDLRSEYGGRQRRGSSPSHHRDAGGAIIRNALHQLEQSGYVMKIHGRGRVLTSKGMSLVDNTAKEVFDELVKVMPELSRYA
ncbi:MAG: 30S ribosomal protein S19e [Candidatus Nitrosocaldus sp.]|nr:30S ribosomal protein S19e [Candidatus Nitrosocaldus sp.]MDW8000722.1 30S ribosomal protein S19e [Candidatus Nitrosocaldus sp.]